MICVLVGFSRSLLALIRSLTSWTQTAKLWPPFAVAVSPSDGYPFIADWNADINLAVAGVQTITQDQLFKLSSVHMNGQE